MAFFLFVICNLHVVAWVLAKHTIAKGHHPVPHVDVELKTLTVKCTCGTEKTFRFFNGRLIGFFEYQRSLKRDSKNK